MEFPSQVVSKTNSILFSAKFGLRRPGKRRIPREYGRLLVFCCVREGERERERWRERDTKREKERALMKVRNTLSIKKEDSLGICSGRLLVVGCVCGGYTRRNTNAQNRDSPLNFMRNCYSRKCNVSSSRWT